MNLLAEELYKQLHSLNNIERNKFLDLIYDEYFDTGVSAEQREREIRILEAYEDDEY